MKSWDEYKKTMVREDTIWRAAKEGDVETLAAFLARGAEINACDTRGYSPLMLACYAGEETAARYLIDKGADVNSSDAAGNTILMGVAFKGHASLARLLIEAGADITRRNKGGQDAEDVATTFGREEVKRVLADMRGA